MRNPALSAAPSVPDRRSREGLARISVSVIVATVLAAQLLIGFAYRGGQTFPVVAYPMYMQAHYEGERLNDYRVYVSADGGEGTALYPEAMGINPWLYQNSITFPLIKGRPSSLATAIAEKACAAGNAAVITINVFDSGYTIRRDGPVLDSRRLMGAATYHCNAL